MDSADLKERNKAVKSRALLPRAGAATGNLAGRLQVAVRPRASHLHFFGQRYAVVAFLAWLLPKRDG